MSRRLLSATFAALLVFALGAGTVLAGEVKGPSTGPGVHNTNTTGALFHANSACAASGLNDYDPAAGQNESRTQTAADSWKYYQLPKGSPGNLKDESGHPTPGLCRGGSNAERGVED